MSRLDQLHTFLNEDPTDTFVLYSIAQEYFKSGDLSKALEYFTRLRQTDPGYVGLYYHLGKLYEAMDQSAQARNTYLEGIGIADAAGDAHAASELRGALQLLNALDDD